MKNIIQELNEYNVPIIKIDESLAKVKYENRFSQKLADANAFLARAGVPKYKKKAFAVEAKTYEQGCLRCSVNIYFYESRHFTNPCS